MIKEIIKIMVLILLAIAVTTCGDDPVTPPELQPGRRDYVWEVDTVIVPFTPFYRIWGDAPDNAWCVGPGGGLDKTIWWYDGSEWKTDGVSRPISPSCIYGFGKNNIYIGGIAGQIWNYDGTDWVEVKHYQKTEDTSIRFWDVYGENPNDIYAVGSYDSLGTRYPVVVHYDGNEWSKNVFSQLSGYSFQRIEKNGLDIKLLALGMNNSNKNIVGLFYSNDLTRTLEKIYEAIDKIPNGAAIQVINNNMYTLYDNYTLRLHNNKESKVITQFTDEKFGGQFYGRSQKDILIRMFDGIAHYNGTDVEYLYKFEGQKSISDAVVLEKEVFFLVTDLETGYNIIYHGKLE